jgi:hypothetical protein
MYFWDNLKYMNFCIKSKVKYKIDMNLMIEQSNLCNFNNNLSIFWLWNLQNKFQGNFSRNFLQI